MSEPEFEMYLSLMSKLLRLNRAQKADIAEELRAHLEERLAELTAQGKSRDDAIRLALDEFGDAGALAWQFTLPHSLRRRRQIMRYSIGSFLALCGIFLLVSLTWPIGPDLPPAVQRAVAQIGETAPDVAEKREGEPPSQSELRRAIEEKLNKRELEYQFQDTTLEDAVGYLGQELDLDFLFASSLDGGHTANIRLQARKGSLSTKTALELMLRQAGGNLDYVIKDGVILITNSAEDYEVQVYDCRDLLANAQIQGVLTGETMGGAGGGLFSVPAELTESLLTQFGEAGGVAAANPKPAESMVGAVLIGVISPRHNLPRGRKWKASAAR